MTSLAARASGASAIDADARLFELPERANAFSFLIESQDKREGGMLYPMMDRVFGEEERSALLARTSLGRRDP